MVEARRFEESFFYRSGGQSMQKYVSSFSRADQCRLDETVRNSSYFLLQDQINDHDAMTRAQNDS